MSEQKKNCTTLLGQKKVIFIYWIPHHASVEYILLRLHGWEQRGRKDNRKLATMSNHWSQRLQLKEEKKLLPTVFFTAQDHTWQRHFIHFFIFYFLSSRCLFIYHCGKCVLYSLSQARPWCNPSWVCGVGPGTLSASGLFLSGIIITWNQHPPSSHSFQVSWSACTNLRQGFLPRNW